MKIFVIFIGLLFCFTLQSAELDLQKADLIARKTAAWFTYSIGPLTSKYQGQCSDYAVMFILSYNKSVGKNVARLVTANNPIPSGTYRLGDKVEIEKLGFYGFPSRSSGFLQWFGQLYVYHPFLGAYPLYLEKAWTPKTHFNVNMLDKKQIHTWAIIGNVSVDPTLFDLWPVKFPSPLGSDQ